ncbi:MAG: hypothetical protein ACM3PY_18510 [Omnitrophica WOR_2 bacterium]
MKSAGKTPLPPVTLMARLQEIASLRLGAISTQGSCNGGKTVICSFGTIASGGSVTITIQVNRVNNKVPVVNTATVTSGIFDIDLLDNTITVEIP